MQNEIRDEKAGCIGVVDDGCGQCAGSRPRVDVKSLSNLSGGEQQLNHLKCYRHSLSHLSCLNGLLECGCCGAGHAVLARDR